MSSTSMSELVNPQAIRWLWPRTTAGNPGDVAPACSPFAVTTRARYQGTGSVKPRCGSLARMGLPLAVRLAATTHAFDAPNGWPGGSVESRRRRGESRRRIRRVVRPQLTELPRCQPPGETGPQQLVAAVARQ